MIEFITYVYVRKNKYKDKLIYKLESAWVIKKIMSLANV